MLKHFIVGGTSNTGGDTLSTFRPSSCHHGWQDFPLMQNKGFILLKGTWLSAFRMKATEIRKQYCVDDRALCQFILISLESAFSAPECSVVCRNSLT